MNKRNYYIDNILKGIVCKKLKINNEDFQNYILKHCAKLPYKEQIVFGKLIAGEDEYSNLILENLWSEFSIKIMNEEIEKIKG
jgi:hypothetical protein